MRLAGWTKERKFYLTFAVVVGFVVGFADLWRGGTTLSAIALTVVYCVLVPAALWAWAPREAEAVRDVARPPYVAAAVAGLAVLAIYLTTLATSTAMWDTSEYLAAAYTFGLPHPPGNPFFVIVGHAFTLLPIAPNVAARVNVLAALSSATAAAMWFLITDHVVRAFVKSRGARLASAGAAALIGATAFTVWNQSVVNEKVYTVSLAGIAIVSWLAVRWSTRAGARSSGRYLLMIAYLCGLGYANHMAGMLPGPAVALLVLVIAPRVLLRWRLLVACAAAMVIGLTPFATQPIRAAYHPPLNEGAPTACREHIGLRCTFSRETLDAFEYNFDRGQYGKPPLTVRQATFGQQTGMWWLYFRWQWLRDPAGLHRILQPLLASLFLALGLFGGYVHWRRDRATFVYFGTLTFTLSLLLVYYLNFKLGWSQDPTLRAEHEVRDRDYFFIWSYSAWSGWVAVGLARAWRGLADAVGSRVRSAGAPSWRAWISTSGVMAIAFVPLVGNWSAASHRHRTATRDIAADMLNSVEPYGVLITVGDNDTFPLWYAQDVEGIRRDVVVVNTSLLNTQWYGRQLITRPVYPYDAKRGPAIYAAQPWRMPAQGPWHMTVAQADAVPDYFELAGPVTFHAGELRATIDPARLEYGVLQRADALVLRMIQDSWPGRPIYFARSAVGYPRELGLENNVLTQGLASKLFVPPAKPSADTVFVQGDGWMDLARTHALWRRVFRAPGSLTREGRWVDGASVSLPALYVYTGDELAGALRALGRAADAQAVFGTTLRVAHATGLDDLARAVVRDSAWVPAGDSAGVSLKAKGNKDLEARSSDRAPGPLPGH
jgi:hypothetical protein